MCLIYRQISMKDAVSFQQSIHKSTVYNLIYETSFLPGQNESRKLYTTKTQPIKNLKSKNA